MSEATALAIVDPATDKTIPMQFAGKLEPKFYCRGWNAKREKYCRHRAGHGTDHNGVGRCSFHGGNIDNADKLKHGQSRRRYSLKNHPRVRELIEQYQDDPDPLNVLDDLAVARALLHDWIERYDDFRTALAAWFDTWEGKYTPIDPEAAAGLQRLVARAGDDPDAGLARAAITFLSTPQEPKPRRFVDIADAIRHVDLISKVVFRVEQAKSLGMISQSQLRLFMFNLERILDSVITDADMRAQLRKEINGLRL